MDGTSLVKAALLLSVVLLAAALLVVWEPWARFGKRAQAHDSLEAYSWGELAALADEIAHCANDGAAVQLAARYGFCDEEGSLAKTAVKEVVLLDGTVVRAKLVGIRHDERSDGGVVGLTFAFADSVHSHAMNHSFEGTEGDDADSTGGWAASDMRLWLDDTLWQELPPDLRGRIVRVQKRTANSVDEEDELPESGKLSGSAADWVRETSDRLWLFSASELCGVVPARASIGVDQTMMGVYEAEGTQYQLFSEYGVRAFEPNEELVDALAGDGGRHTWWLRTKTLEFGDGFWLVGTDGALLNGYGEDVRAIEDAEYVPDELWGPDHARGVLVGFCL